MSLRARLLLATGVVALVALVAADVVTYVELRSFLVGRVDQTLESSHLAVESSVARPEGAGPGGAPGHLPPPTSSRGTPGPTCPPFDGQPVDTAGLAPGTVIEVRTSTGTTVYRCALAQLGSSRYVYPSLPGRIDGYVRDAADLGEPTAYFDATGSGGQSFRVRASVLRTGPAAGGVLVVAAPLTTEIGTLHRLLLLELAVTAAALLCALAVAWWLVRLGMRPLAEMERTARSVATGTLAHRVAGDQARTEVGQLARSLNVMLDRIQGAFAQRDETEAELRESEERMRRLVADASHELRTPLAAVSAYAELFDRGAAQRPDDLSRVMAGIRAETTRMGLLVEDLLLLARLDEGRPLDRRPVDLLAVAFDGAETSTTVGPQWPVAVVSEAPVVVPGDATALRQVVDNLLANVRTHCPPGTTTEISVESDDDHATLTVSDDGPGIAAEDGDRIFERFYRSDPSRARRRGGAGLGLAIVAAIVRAHGGTARVRSTSPSGGARFVVVLPLHDGQRPQESHSPR